MTRLGHVDSLFPHVKEDWWKDAFNETYLRTDGDVVEDPSITEAECIEILSIEPVAKLFGTGTESGNALRVLDLCCGQGRHSIYFAENYPEIEFQGLDSSAYLIEIARLRSDDAKCMNTLFQVGDARHIPSNDNSFDLVILMGNSIGVYTDEEDNTRLLDEVSRTLKPGGIFLVDMVSAEYTKSNFSDGGWEFINGGKMPIPAKDITTGDSGSLACRQRELSTDGKWLASRELVVDLTCGIVQDMFYKFRLYDVEEMQRLLSNSGLVLDKEASQELLGPAGKGNRAGDLGMMASRHLLVAMAQDCTDYADGSVDPLSKSFVHPCLKIDVDTVKGRVVRVTTDVKAGTLLMVDNPYALVPDITPGSRDFLPCSRLECSKRVTDLTRSVSCPNDCISDVVWCSDTCHTLGKPRHDLECMWLKQNATAIVREHGQYDLTMLWIIVRILISRSLESASTQEQQLQASAAQGETRASHGLEFAHSYLEVDKLRSNHDAIAPSKVEHYQVLVNNFLGPDSGFQAEVDMKYIVELICKEEMNAFCLYPKGTSAPGVTQGRGRAYALGLFTRATWMNHDCEPNVSPTPYKSRPISVTISPSDDPQAQPKQPV
ncbi:hypothetical protein VTL71DRAFT_6524 [Oculimacula yallundae]|uniref:Methyltransferase domain-containing protein n=1 Tax=Oculimacula yallundae TaxID=86028 RepID=A0ABR4BZT6_9HELO